MRVKTVLVLIIIVFSSGMALMLSETNDESTNNKISVPEAPESSAAPEAPAVSESVKAKSLEWYYDNLTPEDRKKIRQAMDYAIPRNEIIDGIERGWAVAITSPIGMNFQDVYEPSIQARDYDPNQALNLLEGVFGYRYIPWEINGSEVPYFKMTMTVPTSNIDRTRWASLIGRSFTDIGIDVDLKWWNWDIIMPRVFLDPVGIGHDYEHGGYDAFFVGYDASPDPTYKTYYDKNSFPPSNNYYWIEDGAPTSGLWADQAYPNVTALWDAIYAEPDFGERAKLLKEYQQWYYDEVPTSIIRQSIDIYAMNSSLEGFDFYHGLEQLNNVTIGSQTSAVIAQPGNFNNPRFNPLISNNYFDFLILNNLFSSLSRRRGEYNVTHAVPWLAEKWTPSGGYLTWDVDLTEGIKWSDGTNVTADDVVFTYQAALDDFVGYPKRDILLDILGDASAVTKTGTFSVRFTLPQFYPYVETVLFGVPILQKAQMELIPFANWFSDATNTNYPPIGCGAYMFDSFPDTETIIIKENPYYNQDRMGHNPAMVGGGNWVPNATLTQVTFKVEYDPALAVSGLEFGIYDIIDQFYGLQDFVEEIDASAWGKTVGGLEWGYQELGFNQYSPIWGMNPQDPRVMYPDPIPEPWSKTEWYYDNLTPGDRKKIRQAMDYAIPRDEIINGLFLGYAVKKATPIGQQFNEAYDSGIQARDFDPGLAIELLRQVFGYRYMPWETNGSEVSYFEMTIVAPTTNWLRTQWAGMTCRGFQNVGINVTLKWWNWDIIMPRLFDDPVGTGFNYDHGGFDALFVGFSSLPDADQYSLFSSGYFVPDGDNYGWIMDVNSDDIWDRAFNSTDIYDRLQALKDFQSWYYNEIPESIIMHRTNLFAMDPNLAGFDPFLSHNFQNWTIGAQTALTYARDSNFTNFNPMFAPSVDLSILSNVHGSLAKRRGAYNLTHSVPFLAESWTHSVDFLTWDVTLKQGVLWADGISEVTADDVVFSYQAAFDESTGSGFREKLIDMFGDASNVQKISTYQVRFTLPDFHPYVETEGFSLPILKQAQMGSIPYSQWSDHDTNKGTAYIEGFGPYYFDSFNGTTVILRKSNTYNGDRMGHDPSATGGGIWWPNASIGTVNINVRVDPYFAVNGLEKGKYDFISPNRDMYVYADMIEASLWGKLIQSQEWGYQTLGYNQFSPIWGMNPEDPHVMYPLDYPPEFNLIASSITQVDAGVYEFSATIQNDGYPAWVGTTPITWETLYYDLPLVDGVGTLYESVVDLDLNGDGDKTDYFEVTWVNDTKRQWDAVVEGVRAYSLCEGPPENPWSYRTYYLAGQPKLFQIGSKKHVLYLANNDVASFGLGYVILLKHPSPSFQFAFQSQNIEASDFKMDGASVEVNYNRDNYTETLLSGESSIYTLYIIPNQASEIGSGEVVEFNCTLTVGETVTCVMALAVNWSPDGNIRLRWVPFYQEDLLFEAPPPITTSPTTSSMTTGVSPCEGNPPEVTITGIQDGRTYSGTVTIDVSVTDESDIVSATIDIQDGDFDESDKIDLDFEAGTTWTGSYDLDTTDFFDDTYEVTIRVYDACGNYKTIRLDVTFDNGITEPPSSEARSISTPGFAIPLIVIVFVSGVILRRRFKED